jgi:MFS family permease
VVFKDNLRPYLLIFFVLTAVFDSAILFPFVYSNIAIMQVCLVLAGLSLGLALPGIPMYIAFAYPQAIQGRIAGITMGFGFTGGTIGLVVSSAALSATGNYSMSILTCVAIAVVGAAISLTLKLPQGLFWGR